MDGPIPSNRCSALAEAACAFEERRTGHAPRSVSVVLVDDTLVITLRGSLSPAERALAQTPAGALQVQQFHRQLFASSWETLRQEIGRIAGVEVREAVAEVLQAFTSGTVVQVFLLARRVPPDSWSSGVLGKR